MKKYMSLFLALLMLTALFAGCAKQETAAPAATEAPAPTVTEAPKAEEKPTVAPTVEPAAEPTPEPAPEPVVMRLGSLKGPTTMGMVKLLSDSEAGLTANTYESTVAAAADELTPKLLKGELDMLALPVNAGSVLYNKSNGGVTLLAVNTLGVLYILEKGGETIQTVA